MWTRTTARTRRRRRERSACASRDSPLIGWRLSASPSRRRAGAPRAEKGEQIVQLLIAQAIGAEVGHERLFLARDVAQAALQISLEPLLGVHDLNREDVLGLARASHLLTIARHEQHRFIANRKRGARI